MSAKGFRSLKPESCDCVIRLDGQAVCVPRGQSLLAAMLLADHLGDAADFFCAIGQCQRCLVMVDGVPKLACMTYPVGGESIATQSGDPRPPPWT